MSSFVLNQHGHILLFLHFRIFFSCPMTDISQKMNPSILHSSLLFTKYIQIYRLIFPLHNPAILKLSGQKLSFQFYSWRNWALESFSGLSKGIQVRHVRPGIWKKNNVSSLKPSLFPWQQVIPFLTGFPDGLSQLLSLSLQVVTLHCQVLSASWEPTLFSLRPFHIFLWPN